MNKYQKLYLTLGIATLMFLYIQTYKAIESILMRFLDTGASSGFLSYVLYWVIIVPGLVFRGVVYRVVNVVLPGSIDTIWFDAYIQNNWAYVIELVVVLIFAFLLTLLVNFFRKFIQKV